MMRRLSLLRRRFSPLEERLLAAFRGARAPEARAVLDADESIRHRIEPGEGGFFYRGRHDGVPESRPGEVDAVHTGRRTGASR